MKFSIVPSGFNTLEHVERGQAIYRLWIGPFILFIVMFMHVFNVYENTLVALYSVASYCVLGVGWLYFISLAKVSPNFRRVLIIFLDLIIFSIGLSIAGETYALLIWVPLSISMGNGLRYSPNFGFLSAVVSGICVTIALVFSPYWRAMPQVSIGIVLITVIIPFYAFLLTKKIAEKKLAMEQRSAALEAAIKVDALTGALNRTGLCIELEELLKQAQLPGKICAVLVIDLDGFKSINDIAGHAVGDEVLKQVVTRMKNCLRTSDCVARLGGDEFAISISSLQSIEDAQRIAGKIVQSISELKIPCHHELRVGASIGICILPDPNITTIDDALESADMLMYESKRAGKGRYMVSPIIDMKVLE
jgi:diguanylate cyclase (GGDEF)-like protein